MGKSPQGKRTCASFAARENRRVSTPFPFTGICKRFAKQMSLLHSRAGTQHPGSRSAASAHLDLKRHYLAESFVIIKSPCTAKILHLNISSRRRPQHLSTLSVEVSHCTTQQSSVLLLCKHFIPKEEGSLQDLSQLQSALSKVLSQYQCLHWGLYQSELISLNPYL